MLIQDGRYRYIRTYEGNTGSFLYALITSHFKDMRDDWAKVVS